MPTRDEIITFFGATVGFPPQVQRMRSMAKENPTEESRLARRQLDFTRWGTGDSGPVTTPLSACIPWSRWFI